MEKPSIVKITFRLPRTLRRQFGALLSLKETTQQAFLTEAVQEFVSNNHKELP